MASDHRFLLGVLGWTAALALALIVLSAAAIHPGLGAARVVAALLAVAAAAGLVRHVQRTNRLLARFVEGLRHGDFTTRVDTRGGAGFDALGEALNRAARALDEERGRAAEELRFLEALLDDMPVAVLVVEGDRVRLASKLARTLFDRHDGTRPADFDCYGAGLVARLTGDAARRSEPITLDLGRAPGRAIVRSGTVARLGLPVRVVVVEPIQTMLDAVEVDTQSNLVRVLTHEILNSLTPVTSLAGTAAVLLGEETPDIAEARLAVTTLARRSEGLRRFIESYNAVARAPELRRRRFDAAPFAAEIARLFAADWVEHRLAVDVAPGLVIDADPDLLAHALINLLRNAAQAGPSPASAAEVRLGFERTRDGLAIVIEDNGPGVPPAMRGDVFLPFFTTRAQGTGVGLNLVRQIVVAHGWTIALGESRWGGALFRIDALRR